MTENAGTPELSVHAEPSLNFDQTARLANEAFEVTDGSGFTPARLRWLYERGFSAATHVLALRAEDRKVGQVALVGHRVKVGGDEEQAVALMDLFILKAFRSREAIAALYGEVEQFCVRSDIRFIVAVPNVKATGINQRLLKLQPHLTLDIRVGASWPVFGGKVRSSSATALDRAAGLTCLQPFLPTETTGLRWTAESLWERLQDPFASFGLHTTANLLLISSRRTAKPFAHTLLRGFFPRPATTVSKRDVSAVTAAACRFHRCPAFVYAGLNAGIPLPGWSLPDRLRPSPMILQVRDFKPTSKRVQFDRFELLDFDFA